MSLSLVFILISMHFIIPLEIPFSPTIFQFGSFHYLSKVKPWDLTMDVKNHLQMFYAQSFWITFTSSCLITIASIELVNVYSLHNVITFSLKKKFTTYGPSTSMRHCFVRLSPIEENSPLLFPIGVWVMFQFQCG